MRRAQDRARRSKIPERAARRSSIMEREAQRSNRAHQARSNLRAAREARDENVPAKRADFFTYLRIIYTFVTITKCQHTTRVMATHHETVGGIGEPLQIPINELFTFQGRPDK